MFELTDQVCVVTGAARGIGKGIAVAAAQQGARVVIADVLPEEARQTAAEIAQTGAKALAVDVDVTDLEQVQALFTKIRDVFGPVNILVNNAGWDKMTPFIHTGPDVWDKIIRINYRGVLNCVYAAAQDMMAADRGKIISIASDAGRVGSSGEAVYSGTKAAIIAFSKAIAREFARHHINVNVVCPGPTPTPLADEMQADSEFGRKVFASMEKIIPLRRLGTPEDIAYAVVFLASREADFITGQVLSVSGGLTMV